VKVVYLMVVHKDPMVLKRAIGTLLCEDCAFFIHVDRKTDIRAFTDARGERVFFSGTRIPVYWGEFSQVRAAILLMRQALGRPVNYDYFVLLTGSTYPLRSGRYIQAFLKENRGLEFMSMVRMPAPGKPVSRINTLRYPSSKPVRRFAFRLVAKLGLARRDYRKHLDGLPPYSGVASWALTRDACRYLLEFIGRNPFAEKYFENTFAPDEMFFHTILGSSPFCDRIRRDLLYDRWSRPGPHPSMITDADVARFRAHDKVWVEDMYGSGEALFARKFSDERLDLVGQIDEMIREKEGRAVASGL
jgi:Core-2/I-Branching enzyme